MGAWTDGEDTDDDFIVSALPGDILRLVEPDFLHVAGEVGVALGDYLSRIVERCSPELREKSIRRLALLLSVSDEGVAEHALAYLFFYEPTDETGAHVSEVLKNSCNLGYPDCLSSVKQLLESEGLRREAACKAIKAAIARAADSETLSELTEALQEGWAVCSAGGASDE